MTIYMYSSFIDSFIFVSKLYIFVAKLLLLISFKLSTIEGSVSNGNINKCARFWIYP